jgi:hypothetical protein
MRKMALAILAALFAGSNLAGASAQIPHDSPHRCVNPAGRERNFVTVSGMVLAVNGDLAQFREDNGTTITIDQGGLLRSNRGLQLGAHYTLQGTFSNDMFLAQLQGNGYPHPGSTASVHGIITAVGGDHVTLMQGLFSTITIDDQQAINNGIAQNLFVGRTITAWGYWSGGTFYATSMG